jgi:peroxiredoxin Q/BCP
MASSLPRRRLLKGMAQLSIALAAAALLKPRPAQALGGVLPALDAEAPEFSLEGVSPDQRGDPQPVRLSRADLAGQWVVLYFYPRDFTSGCTLEARGFQRDLATYRRAGATVVGISADDADSHASFCGSEGLAFSLLSDPGGVVSRRYGSWMAPYSLRHTFLIDPAGILRARWVGVNPGRHSAEVLEELGRQQARAVA